MSTVLGIDPSLQGTGLAVVRDGHVRLTGKITSKGTKEDTLLQRSQRLDSIVAKVAGVVSQERPDLVAIEGPSLASKFGSVHDRSGLWWLLVSELITGRRAVVEIPPSNRMMYATGKGQAHKDVVLATVVGRYPQAGITGNNEADALLLAAMGARHLGEPVETSLPLTHLRALDKVKWP